MPHFCSWKFATLAALALATRAAAQEPVETESRSGTSQERHIDFGGYASFRYDLSDAPGQPPSFALRRVVIGGEGDLSRRLRAEVEIELEHFGSIELEKRVRGSRSGEEFEQETEATPGSEISLEAAWVEFASSRRFGLRGGAVLVPVGRFNREHEDPEWDLPHRPLVVRGAAVLPSPAAWSEVGVGVRGALGEEDGIRVGYEAYVLNGAEMDSNGATRVGGTESGDAPVELEVEVGPRRGAMDGSARADAFAARIGIDGGAGAELAISGYAGRYTREGDRPAMLRIVGLDGRAELAGFRFEGEALSAWYDDAEQVARGFVTRAVSGLSGAFGGELKVSVEGLSKRRYGFWLDVARPFASEVEEPAGLTLVPIVRYERVWFDGDVSASVSNAEAPMVELRDRSQDRLSVGLAIRPSPAFAVHLAVHRSRALEGAMISPAVDVRAVQGLAVGAAFGF